MEMESLSPFFQPSLSYNFMANSLRGSSPQSGFTCKEPCGAVPDVFVKSDKGVLSLRANY